MDVLEDLRLDEEAERVDAALSVAAKPFALEARYRGALRFLRRLSREMQAVQGAPRGAASVVVDPASPSPVVIPRPRPNGPAPWKAKGLKMWVRSYLLLEARPRMPYGEMAVELYGKVDRDTKSNVRSISAAENG